MIEVIPLQYRALNNQHQTNATRVLCVCSIGMMRSPTMANVLHQAFNYNTRSCGADKSAALIPISEALILWADLIVFVEPTLFYNTLEPSEIELVKEKRVKLLNIPDIYDWNDSVLQKIVMEQFTSTPDLKFDPIPDIGI